MHIKEEDTQNGELYNKRMWGMKEISSEWNIKRGSRGSKRKPTDCSERGEYI